MRSRRCLVSVALFLVVATQVAAHPKTDVVILVNGDRIRGEIKGLRSGILSVSTDAAGTVSFKWAHIQEVTSTFEYQLETTGGDRFYGSLAAPERAAQLRIEGDGKARDIPLLEVFSLTPIEHGFWKKLDGSINLGFSYTQSNEALQYSFNGDVRSRTLKTLDHLQWNSIFNTQEGGDPANQQSVTYRHTRFLTRTTSVFGLGQFQSNPAQGFDLRSNLGGGAGRFLRRKPRGDLMALAGLVYVREEVVDSTRVDNSAAALLGIDFGSYSYDHPKRTLTLGINSFTNITDTPRFRVQLSFKLSWEVINNFDVSLNILESYDSRPPTEDAEKNDLSFVTSLGYSF